MRKSPFDPVWDEIAEDYCHDVPVYEQQWLAVGSRLGPGQIVLDVGCGDARHRSLAMDRSCRYLGIDRSIEMLRRARAPIDTEPPLSQVLLGEATCLPLGPESVDWSICLNNTIGILRGWDARASAVREMMRVSRRGVLIEYLVDVECKESAVAYFRDREGKYRTYISARFHAAYFAQFAGPEWSLEGQEPVRKSTNATFYWLADFRRRGPDEIAQEI